MALNKQAKILSDKQLGKALKYVESFSRNPIRNQLLLLLSSKAGLRSIEMANLKWSDVLTADGTLANHITITNKASKGSNGGRLIPMHNSIKDILLKMLTTANISDNVISFERSKNNVKPHAITHFFYQLYKDIGLQGCSSHSGRRTFITNAAKKITSVGGSLKDVQYLAGHSNLNTTQRYIEGDSQARYKLIGLI